MDSLILEGLLAPNFLGKQISRQMELESALLLSATPQNIDAPGYLSDLVGVTLTWSEQINAPTNAVLKISHVGFGQPELPFYENIAKRLDCSVVPRFYAGGVDEATGRTWLLLENLSSSHERPSLAPLPPTFARCASIVEALAKFHTSGWDMGDWNDVGLTLWERLRSSKWLEGACHRLFEQAGDALDDDTRNGYARFVRCFPVLVEQAEQLRGKTLIYGDAHVWNWMLPRDGTEDVPKLIDWDGWHVGVGVWDLAYMMAVQWDRAVRQRFEMSLLDRYHAALAHAGVTDYSRDALQNDYRLAVLLHMRTPITRFARNMSAYVWWPQLSRIRHAVEDLHCLDLLD